MCGICGIISFEPHSLGNPFIKKVEKMNSALAHRGPDDKGLWFNDTLALGHTRLSIIDLSEAGHQPMKSENAHSVITFNGEIYNYLDLKKNTPDYNYTGKSDTETLLAAYQKDGVEMLKHLNGMFAFAIWDEENKTLLLARDQIGIKPLYYFVNENYLIFASEIRALLASELIPRKLNRDSLDEYLAHQTVYAPNTLIKDISVLLPGHFIEVKNGSFIEKSFWTFEENLKPQPLNRKETEKAVRQKLRASVERQMMSDVPFGAFLSGGIDSSVIVGLMREVNSGDIDTFTVSFAEKQFDESQFARTVSERFNTKHHEIKLSPSDFLADLPNALDALDHPSGDAINTYIVAKATREEGIKMALSGLGGDELFAGYPIFKQSAQLQKLKILNTIPKSVRKLSGSILKTISPSVKTQKIANVLGLDSISPSSAYSIFREIFNTQQRSDLLTYFSKSTKKNDERHIDGFNSDSFDNSSLFSQISIAEISGYMQNVLLRDSDQMTMASALELRVPLLDVELIELVLSIPDVHKNGVGSKPLLTACVSDLIPTTFFDRPKMGFVLPFENWMRNELSEFCEIYLKLLAQRIEFQNNTILNLWQTFISNKNSVSWSRLWTLVALSHWLNKNEIQ